MRVVLVGTEASEVDRTNCGEKGGSCQKPRDEARSSSGRSMRAMSAFSPRGEPQVNRMQQRPALRMKRGSKGHGRVLSPRGNTSETRAGPSAASLPPLPACLLDFGFPAFTLCVSLPFLGFEGGKIKHMKEGFSTLSRTHPYFQSPDLSVLSLFTLQSPAP